MNTVLALAPQKQRAHKKDALHTAADKRTGCTYLCSQNALTYHLRGLKELADATTEPSWTFTLHAVASVVATTASSISRRSIREPCSFTYSNGPLLDCYGKAFQSNQCLCRIKIYRGRRSMVRVLKNCPCDLTFGQCTKTHTRLATE